VNEWILPNGSTEHPVVYILAAILAMALTGVSKGGFGGGVGMLSTPVMMMVAPAEFALGLWLPLLVLCDLFTIHHYPSEWKLRPIAVLAPWMFGGIVAGWLLLDHISPRAIKITVGVLAVVFVGIDWFRAWLKRRVESPGEPIPWDPTWRIAAPLGVAAGISTMLAHAAGPITTIYFLSLRLDKRTFVGSTARFFFLFNTLKVPFYLHLVLINAQTLARSLWLVPFAAATVWFGAVLNKWVSAEAFTRIIYALLAFSGLYLVWVNSLNHAAAR